MKKKGIVELIRKDIRQRFDDDYLLGCIKYDEKFEFYLMPIAWWILNYKLYDPGYDPSKWEGVFRNNILNVTDDLIFSFIQAIESDKLLLKDLAFELSTISKEYANLYFFIDLDNKLFINFFADIEVESYLPNRGWQGRFENPMNYLPKELKAMLI